MARVNNRDGNIDVRGIAPEQQRVNGYYASLAGTCRVLKHAAFLLLIVYGIVMTAVFHSYMTYDNFKYMLKDLDTSQSSGENNSWEDVHYDALSDGDFALYRGDLVTVGVSRVSLYNASGNRLYTDTRTLKNPVLEYSEKYLLVYDLGSVTYTLYNSFTSVYTADADYTIYGGDICDEGSFVLVTGSRDSKYNVTVYDSSFKAIVNVKKNKYVIDAAIRSDGDEIAIVSVDVDDNTVMGEVVMIPVGEETAKCTHTIAGAIPLCAGYFSDGSLAVICDTCICFYAPDGSLAGTYSSSAADVSRAAFTDNSLAAVFAGNAVGNESDVLLFDTSGNMIYNIEINSRVEDIAAFRTNGGYDVCLLTPTEIIRHALVSDNGGAFADTEKVQSHSGGISRVLIDGSGNVLACSASSTVQVFADE